MNKLRYRKVLVNTKNNNSPNGDNNNLTEDTEDLMSLLSVLFEQVKLQQEVRDRWFGHYLSIIAAISALAALCFGYFVDRLGEKLLFGFLSAVFLLAGILGILFYILYIRQRQNYRKQYRLLSVVQEKIMKQVLTEQELNAAESTFVCRRWGADFVTLLIENIICGTCFGLSSGFLLLALSISYKCVIFIVLCIFVICLVTLLLVKKIMEKE